MYFTALSLLGIVIATILNIILGILWYSPKFLGTTWAREHNFDLTELRATPWHYVAAILVSLITVVVFSGIVHNFGISTVSEGLKWGFYFWLGFIATSHFSGVIWAKKSLKSYLIDAGFYLVSLLMIGAVLAWLYP